jgi:Holliday junction resolvasome RuvABC endonuclease subunit
MTMFLGVDPGKTTGYAWVSYRDKQMILHDFGNVPWPKFMQWVKDWDTIYYKYAHHTDGFPDENVIVVCEDFILRKSADWTPTPVTKQIGVCYGKAYDLGWHFTVQQPMIKSAAYKMAKYKGTPTHWTDAYVHAVYAINQGVDPETKIIW